MILSALPAFLVASATAFAVWALSPWLTGYKEPWDAPSFYYPGGLLLAGMVSGVITAKFLWAHYLGSIFGQFLYELLFLPIGSLAIVGFFFLVVWSLLFLGGAYIGSLVRTRAMSQ